MLYPFFRGYLCKTRCVESTDPEICIASKHIFCPDDGTALRGPLKGLEVTKDPVGEQASEKRDSLGGDKPHYG